MKTDHSFALVEYLYEDSRVDQPTTVLSRQLLSLPANPLNPKTTTEVASSNTYDPLGRLRRQLAAGHDAWNRFVYDAFGFVIREEVLAKLGARHEFEVDFAGNITKHTESRRGRNRDSTAGSLQSYTTTSSYDQRGRLRRSKDAENGLISNDLAIEALTGVGNTVRSSTVDRNGFTTAVNVDPLGQQVQVQNVFNATATTTYDSAGNPISTTAFNNGSGTRQVDAYFDQLGRQRSTSTITNSQVDPQKHDTIRTFVDFFTTNPNEWDQIAIDANGNATKLLFDAEGRTIAMQQPELSSSLIGGTAPLTVYSYNYNDEFAYTMTTYQLTGDTNSPGIRTGSWNVIISKSTRTTLSESDRELRTEEWTINPDMYITRLQNIGPSGITVGKDLGRRSRKR